MVDVFDKYEQRGLERGLAEGEANGIKRGMEQGLLQGRKEGKEQGMEQGIEQGRLLGEVNVYYTTLNYSPEKIAEKTHQPVDVIQQVILDLKRKKK